MIFKLSFIKSQPRWLYNLATNKLSNCFNQMSSILDFVIDYSITDYLKQCYCRILRYISFIYNLNVLLRRRRPLASDQWPAQRISVINTNNFKRYQYRSLAHLISFTHVVSTVNCTSCTLLLVGTPTASRPEIDNREGIPIS